MQTKANGISINYRIEGGAGPWLMLSNSLATDLSMWDAQARELSGAFRVLRYDQRGHGKTARIVRDILPDAHFATVYAKPMGRPLVDTFITEVSQDTWIYFPWDLGLTFQPPIRDGATG